MDRLIAAEFFKLRKRMMTWVVLLIAVGLVVLLYTVLWSTSVRVAHFGEGNQYTGIDLRRALFLPGAVPYGLQVVGTFGAILAMILAAGSIGSEYAWGTVRLMATAASGRVRLLSAKLLVVCGLTAVGTLIVVLAALAYSLVIALYYGGASTSFLSATFVRDQLEAYGRTLLVLAPYVTLAFSVAVIGRSTLAGVGTGMGVAFAEPLIDGLLRTAGSPWKNVPNYLLNANRQIVLLQNKVPAVLPRLGGRGDVTSLSPPMAGLLLAGYAVAFIALALIVFRRRDIGSGQ
ncbi:MAG TPA: ABC transporter permease [Dehalococcoidia bacterium]|nr:ABC transporter permease [Dehalococcoidia bacterium]